MDRFGLGLVKLKDDMRLRENRGIRGTRKMGVVFLVSV